MGNMIRPNDIVMHQPSGETWVVAGVHYDGKTLIPMGYPFPSLANTNDCILVESRYLTHPQEASVIKNLRNRGLEAYIDVKSAMLHGLLPEV